MVISTSKAVKGLADQRTIGFLGQGSSDYGDFLVPERHDQIMAAFVIVLAAAEAAVALAIVLAMFRNFGTVHADSVQSLKR